MISLRYRQRSVNTDVNNLNKRINDKIKKLSIKVKFLRLPKVLDTKLDF